MGEFTLQLLHLVRRLLREDTGQYFGAPVAKKWGTIASEYLRVIKKPMDLGTIEDRLQGNKYVNPEQVVEDIRLTFANAKSFNPKEDRCHQEAVRLLDLFEQRYHELEDKLERAAQKAALQKAARVVQTAPTIPITAEHRKELLQIAEMMRVHPWPAAVISGASQQAELMKRGLQDNSFSTNLDLAAAVDKLFLDAKHAAEFGPKKKKSDQKELRHAQQRFRKLIDSVYNTSPSTRKLAAMLDALYLDPRTLVFQPPVNFFEYPTYKELIQTPMNLDKVRQNMQQGAYEAPNEFQFFNDVQLVWDNCKQFNAEGSDIYLRANECEAKFKTIIKEIWGSNYHPPAPTQVAHTAPVEKKKPPPQPSVPKHTSTTPAASVSSAAVTEAGNGNDAVVKYSKKFANRVLKKVRSQDTEQIFFHEVTDAVAPQYSELIANPIWIGKIEAKVMADSYNSLDALYADFKLMWSNCAEYNQSGTVYDYGLRLNKEFEKLWKKALKKAQKKLLATPIVATPSTTAPATPIRKREPPVAVPRPAPQLPQKTMAEDEDNDSIDVMHDDPEPDAAERASSKEEEADEDLVIDIMSAPTPTKSTASKLPLTPIPPSPIRLVSGTNRPPFSGRPPSSILALNTSPPATPTSTPASTPASTPPLVTPSAKPTAPSITPPLQKTVPQTPIPAVSRPAIPSTTPPLATKATIAPPSSSPPLPTPTRTTAPIAQSTATASTPATKTAPPSNTPAPVTRSAPTSTPPMPTAAKTTPAASTPAIAKPAVPSSTPPLAVAAKPTTTPPTGMTKPTSTPPIVTTKTTPPKPIAAEIKENISHPPAAVVVDVTGQVTDDVPAGPMVISLSTQHVTTRKKMLQEKLARKKALTDPHANTKGLKSALLKKKKKKKTLSGHERTVLLHKASHFFARPPSSPAVYIQAIIPAASNSVASVQLDNAVVTAPSSSSSPASLVDNSSLSSSSSSTAASVPQAPIPFQRTRKCDLSLK